MKGDYRYRIICIYLLNFINLFNQIYIFSDGLLNTSKSSRRKKSRTAFSEGQIDGLERRYAQQRYLSVSERSDVADQLDLTSQQVKTWFQNRRMKEKKQRGNTVRSPSPPLVSDLKNQPAILNTANSASGNNGVKLLHCKPNIHSQIPMAQLLSGHRAFAPGLDQLTNNYLNYSYTAPFCSLPIVEKS